MTEIYHYIITAARSRAWRSLMKGGLLPALAALLASACLTACVDELELPDDGIPEGETTMMTEIRFTPLVTSDLVGGKSRADEPNLKGNGTVAPTGSAMDVIDNLYLLFYSLDGNLIRCEQVDLTKYKPVLEDRVEADAVNGIPAQEQTYCIKDMPLRLANGRYFMYAVANIAGLDTKYGAAIQTIEGLRSIKLEWVSDDISKNREMFGFFTNGKQTVYSNEYKFDDNPVVEVSPRAQAIHAWIRRAVSKLTIDFDGSGLRDNVFVYIKDAKIYDIADGAYLGKYSCVGDAPQRDDILKDRVHGGFGIFGKGSAHTLVYGKGTDPEAWPTVTNSQDLKTYKHNFPDGAKVISLHDETAYCLPFYENMQGPGAMKYQDADGDGKVDHPLGGSHTGSTEENDRVWTHEKAKDSKPNGTFVEVTGWYENRNNDNVTSGPIKFRFMLGKDVINNFDCERNHHYKLTLAFKGNGNDVDWHIEYQETTGIHLPSPLYISYLYNKSMTFPVRINTGGREIEYIQIDITKNNWAPYYNRENGGKIDIAYHEDADKKSGYGVNNPELGFLSLIKTGKTRITETDLPNGNQGSDLKNLKSYYDKKYTDEGGLTITRGRRRYLATPGVHGTEDNGKYTVRKDGDELELQIPLYTRAKQMFKESAYTGNNPYVGYPREAEIMISVKYKGVEKPDVEHTPVYQVRRLVNPKGIYRERGNNNSFHVTLMELQKETEKKFTKLQSIGSWKAYVLYGDGFITLDGKKEVHGGTLDYVDFNVQFEGSTPENESRFGIIEILYHNYTCVHQIYVRQGDAPTRMFSQDVNGKYIYWHAKNMRLKNKEVDHAVDEGSLFRFGKWDSPIDACNQRYKNPDPWVNIKSTDFVMANDAAGGNYVMANDLTGSKKNWGTIGSEASSSSFVDMTDATGNVYSLPLVPEIVALRDASEQAYGVLYGDGASGVQEDLDKVYGFQRDEKGTPNDTGYGMRGVFAYVGNSKSAYYGNHVFFPLGASGYGHRKHSGKRAGWSADSEPYDGILRYCAGRTQEYKPADPLALPLFFDLYKRPGAVYWAKQQGQGEKLGYPGTLENAMGIDINYFTFDFNYLHTGSMYGQNLTANHSDACFIRCVDRRTE